MNRIETIDELIIELQKISNKGNGQRLVRIFNYNPDYFGDGLPIDKIDWDALAGAYLLETK